MFQVKHKTIVTIFLILLLGCSGKKETKKEVLRPVVYQEIGFGGDVQSRTFSGTAKSGTETKLSFKVSGTIESLNVKVGQEVRKNELIARLEDSDFELQYEQADAAVKNADAVEKQAKSNYERVRALYENNSTSLSEYESAKASYKSAKASESSAKKSRKLAKAQLGYCNLYAPLSGKIATVDAEVNENVSAGQQIVMLNSEGDLEVNLGVPESFISSIRVQDEVQVDFPSIPNETFEGIVTEVSFSISSQTSTYPVVVKISDRSNLIRPGMAASVTFQVKKNTNDSENLLVPTPAVGEDEEGNFVFILEPKDDHYVVERRSIEVGTLSSDGFEILDGLEEGELVATAGLQTLLAGMKVKLFNE